MDFEHFSLDNGLKVYLTKETQSPRFHAEIAIKAGAKNDPKDSTGIAHYLEHMLFKGTKDIGTTNYLEEEKILDKITNLYDKLFLEKNEVKREQLLHEINELSIEAGKHAISGELESIYQKIGGTYLNAYTSMEETVYTVSLPKNRLEQWAKIESNRFEKPVFRLFQSELETVYEEKNRSMDNKEVLLYHEVQRKLFQKHQYGTQTILGSIDHLKNPSLSKMYDFYQNYYVPNNMAIFISGDIDYSETKKIIEKYFSNWKQKEVPEFKFEPETNGKGRELIETFYKGDEKVLIGFRTKEYKHEDRATLSIIDMLLDSGLTGLIKLNLVNKQKVRKGGAYPLFFKDHGAQYLYAVLKNDQTHKEVEELLLEQLNNIKTGNFNEENLKGIILDYEIRQKKELEVNLGRVNFMKESFLKGVSVEEVLQFTDKLKKISKKEIIETANKYFGNDYIVGYRIDKEKDFPKIEKPNLKKVELINGKKSKFIQEVENLNIKEIEPKWVDFEKDFTVKSISPGVLLYYSENPVNDVFNFSINYDFGSKHLKNFGYILDELNFAGVDNLSPEAVKMKLFNMGSNASFNCKEYNFSLNLSGSDSEFEKSLELCEKILWEAKLNQTHLNNKLKNIVDNREFQKKDLNTIRKALSNYIRFSKDSSYLERTPKEELINLKTELYHEFINTLKKQNYKVYYTGKLPIEKVEEIIKKYHQPKNIKFPLLNPSKKPAVKLRKNNEKLKIYFLNYNSVQSHIDLVIPGEEINIKETPINNIYNEYFDGGMGTLLFQEIRESRSLAYSTWSRLYQGNRLGDEDQLLGYVGTQSDKTIEAFKVFHDLLINTPKLELNFVNAKKSLENKYRSGYINFRNIFETINYWYDIGYLEDPRRISLEKIKDINLEDLSKYIKEKVSSRNMIFSIVGNKDLIDLKELGKFAEIEEVKIEQIFTD